MNENESKDKVSIPIDSLTVEGSLTIPEGAKGVVIFAHGSGSSRLSPRNMFVAQVLNDSGLGTLLFDLLTREEDLIYENRFNIDLLATRLKMATLWLMAQPQAKGLKIGYFGSSTGAAAALIASADLGTTISAVVSRGGRPDLADKCLERVLAPTLLIVGGYDFTVLELNQKAYKRIKVEKELKIIPRATHLFEEPGALEKVAFLAAEWFKKYLSGPLSG